MLVMQKFEIVGEITGAETFAEGRGIRDLSDLINRFGGKNWRKRKGLAVLRNIHTGGTRLSTLVRGARHR
ncbi:MAG: hypothetical protein LBU43_12910 [Candidatus Accumulibacter sp.]|nr:hypothetical protein [Accumulibacter sp.]